MNENTNANMEFDEEKLTQSEVNKYSKNYSEESFFGKIKSAVKKSGVAVIYKALQLFYVTQNPNCPTRIKATIFAALGYFISPLDLLPDFTPVIGYTDDAAAIATAIAMAHIYIDDTVREKAKKSLQNIFGKKILSEIE